eukprot:TRINITY_DN14690_c0_g1_i2.p1 TRINITY_DN14690_c0_g1~~TRINITY_DN14690_c0_g1_i2.p1  ORF type:complete len:128 (-),score=24.69 TRINITY_DN14690_c0_g1_i2:65-391(-)
MSAQSKPRLMEYQLEKPLHLLSLPPTMPFDLGDLKADQIPPQLLQIVSSASEEVDGAHGWAISPEHSEKFEFIYLRQPFGEDNVRLIDDDKRTGLVQQFITDAFNRFS